jgi:hypothetical protein
MTEHNYVKALKEMFPDGLPDARDAVVYVFHELDCPNRTDPEKLCVCESVIQVSPVSEPVYLEDKEIRMEMIPLENRHA